MRRASLIKDNAVWNLGFLDSVIFTSFQSGACARVCACLRVGACASASLGFVFEEETFPRDGKREREPWAGCLGPESPGRPGPPTWPCWGRTACSSQVPPVEDAQVLAADLQSGSKLGRSSKRLVKDHVLGMLRSSLDLGRLDICVLWGSHLLHPHALGVMLVPMHPSAPTPWLSSGCRSGVYDLS